MGLPLVGLCVMTMLLLLLLLLSLQDSANLPLQGRADLLQLAINCSRPETATAAAVHLAVTIAAAAAASNTPALLESALARKLLLTAVTRQHVAAVKHMVVLDDLQQYVDAATLEAAINTTLTQGTSGSVVNQQLVTSLCSLPAAKQLSFKQVAQLLATAVQQDNDSCVDSMCKLPATKQLSSEQVMQLLATAVEQDGRFCVESMCELPAAQQLSSEQVWYLLQLAMEDECGISCMYALSDLPAGQELSEEQTAQLEQATMQYEEDWA
jgi:hypothetical protein